MMTVFSLFLVSENTWDNVTWPQPCPTLHATLGKPFIAASLLVVLKGENEVVLTHYRLHWHPQFFQLHLVKINTPLPHPI